MTTPKWCRQCGRTIQPAQKMYRNLYCFPCASKKGLIMQEIYRIRVLLKKAEDKFARLKEKSGYQKMMIEELQQRLRGKEYA